MKTPFNDDDYFKGSTMSFGEHLEELRTALVYSIYALAVAIALGMWVAPYVVGTLKSPIEKALAKYKRERASLETAAQQIGTNYPIERMNLIEEGGMVPEDVQVQPGELLDTLRTFAPGQFDSIELPTHAFVPEDFEVAHYPITWFGVTREFRLRTRAFCERVTSVPKEMPDSVEGEVWKRLSAEAQELVGQLAMKKEEEITLYDRRQLASELNRLLDARELTEAPACRAVLGEGHIAETIKYLRDRSAEGAPGPQEIRRLNRLVLAAAFAGDLRAPQLPLVRLALWKKAEARVQSLNAQEAFMIWMKASFISGLVIASPVIFVNLWLFVAAGLYPHEKQYVHLYLPVSIGLFLAGAGLAFGFVFEPVLDFLFWFNRQMDIEPDPRIGEWLNFVLLLPLAFGLSFQLPLIMLFLNRVGVVSVELYIEHWRVALLIIAVASMIITPGGDPYSLLLMMIPLVGLYFLGIGMCRWMPRGRSPFTEVYEP